MNGTHSGSDPDHSALRSGSETAIGPLTVAEAAALLGVEPRTVIKYRQQGKIHGEKQGKAWRLWLTQGFIDTLRAEHSGMRSGSDPDHSAPRSGTHSGPVGAAYRVIPAEIERAIERTGERYVSDFAALYNRISAEVGRLYEGQLAAKDQVVTTQAETIAELRRRAEAAEAERDRLVAAQTPQEPLGALKPVEEVPQGLRARLGRWWRG